MGKTSKVVDGKLEITQTGDVIIETLSREEIVGKIAEVQTRIDHRNLDNAADETKKSEWVSGLTEIAE